MSGLSPRLFAVGVVMLLMALMGPPDAQAQLRKLSLSQLVEEADQICLAECQSRETVIRDGTFITQYKLKPSEVWKGKLSLNSEGELLVEELGGVIEDPIPIAMKPDGMFEIEPGDQALLFMQMPKQHNAKQLGLNPSKLSKESPRLIGRADGLYTVMRHPETGQSLIRRGRVSRLSQKKLGETIDRLWSRIEPELQAETQRLNSDLTAEPEAKLDRIVPFEPLDSVRDRIQGLVSRASEREKAGQ